MTCWCSGEHRFRAVAAVEYFVYAMTKFTGAYAAVLGGLDAFVFTAGIGEHWFGAVRAALCRKLAWLGVKLDERAKREAVRAFPPRTAACRCGSSRPMRN